MKMFDNGAEGCGAVTCAFWALGQAVYRVGTLGFADVHDPVRDAYDEGRISGKQYVAGATVSLAVPIINGATVVSTGGTGTSAAAAASTTLVNRVINASITGGAVALANDSVTQAAHVSSGIQSEYSVKQAALTTGAGLLVGGVVGAGAELVPVIASKLKDVAGSLVDAARSAQAARQIAKAIDAGEVPAMPGAAARQISADASTQSVPASSIRSQITQEGNGLGVSAAGVRGQGVLAEVPPTPTNPTPMSVRPVNPDTRFYVAPNGETLDAQQFARNSNFRKGVRDATWNDAVNPETGLVRDPLSGAVMNKADPWEMGHRPMMEYWKERANAINKWLYGRVAVSRKDFLDRLNDPSRYRPELPASNRSHRGEDKSSAFIE